MGTQTLAQGFPIATSVLGVLIIGAVFKELDDLRSDQHARRMKPITTSETNSALTLAERIQLTPTIFRSAVIGTVVGALPGIGSTLAATFGAIPPPNAATMMRKVVNLGKARPRGSPQQKRPTLLFLGQT